MTRAWLVRRAPAGGTLAGWPTPAVALAWTGAAMVAGLVMLVPTYLTMRAVEGAPTAIAALARPSTIATLGRTAALAIAVPAASILVAVPLAWLTTRTDLPGRRLWAVLAVLPLAIPSYVLAYLYATALGPRGILFDVMAPFLPTLDRLPSIYGFPGALMAVTAATYPYVLLTTRAALLGVDPGLESAARSLGLGPWATFNRVVLPQLRPALAAGGLLAALYSVRDFGAVAIMRFDTFSPVIYSQYRNAFDRAGAAALALLVGVLGVALVVIERRARPRARYHTARASAAGPAVEPLGRWRVPALAFCGVVVTVTLILPTSVLGMWLVRGLLAGESLNSAQLWTSTVHSAVAAGLAAGATVLAAAPVALLAARRSGRVAKTLEAITWLGFALPGIAVALAFVFFGVRAAPFLYQRLPMLVAAYVVLFLPLAVGTLRASLAQIHPHLEQSARLLGSGPGDALRRVTLPLAAPGIAAAAVLSFLSAMKELPATLILAPTGFQPLATRVWSSVGEAYFAQAAAPALLLIALSSLPAAVLMMRRTL